MAENLAHWTSKATVWITPHEMRTDSLYSIPLYTLWFKDRDHSAPINLGDYMSVERAVESVGSGEHDMADFEPSKIGVPASVASWNGLR